jgi:hypothetical protein
MRLIELLLLPVILFARNAIQGVDASRPGADRLLC